MTNPLDCLRRRINDYYRLDETRCVAELIRDYQKNPPNQTAVAKTARGLVLAVRSQREHAAGVDHLMHEFSLSSEEGIALMCVAEALLRIPDAETADRLIRDKLSKGAWASHLGHGGSLFVSAATWGLLITGKLVATRSDEALGNVLVRLVARCGEPIIRKATELAMQLLGRQFVMGENITAALERSQDNEERSYSHSFDMLGEAALTANDAEQYFRAYRDAIETIGHAARKRGPIAGPGVSVKLSALHPRYTRLKKERVLQELFPKLLALAKQAKHHDIALTIDAEEADRLELSLDLLERLVAHPDTAGWGGLGFVVQAYQKRAPALVDYLVALARSQQRSLMIRLVKGAYWDSEIKRAQVDGLADYPVFTRKSHSDLCYLVCVGKMLDARDDIYPQFATHNAHTLAAVMQLANDRTVSRYEFQCLHGMGEPLYNNVVGNAKFGKQCRIYAPVGSYETLLPYLVRRLLENGSNSSFVNQIVDEKTPVDALIADPLTKTIAAGATRHPRIPLPSQLFGDERQNSRGIDLSDEHALEALESQLQALHLQSWSASPLIAGLTTGASTASLIPVLNPANRHDCVGHVTEATEDDARLALDKASAFAAQWYATSSAQRAEQLVQVASRLQQHAVELISLCMREAGKTRANAIAEMREAVDFCHYYASQAAHLPEAAPSSGPIICISPWNFPLAIFVGQIAAALVSGHTVIAKPARQTPLLAAFATRLFHEAGIPPEALQFAPGAGVSIGNLLTQDPRIAGVIFTGSTQVAKQIERTLAGQAHDVTLIAETGGINTMIVDSSAHLEQVVQDVMASAFDSAGQRCSALRMLCVQEEIAERLLHMLKRAMQELKIGDPGEIDTDIGPVIDTSSQQALQKYITSFAHKHKLYFKLSDPSASDNGSFVTPALLEIDSPADIREEIFGPVLHILRFKRENLTGLIDDINALGYGLTFGIQSRIEETIDFAAERIKAGNLYVNRNMVGAVVGVQPFGGEGNSGTGPKAGGPLYLHRLANSAECHVLSREGVRQSGGNVTERLVQLSEWALRSGHSRLAHACAEYREHSVFPQTVDLRGPSGETNRLDLLPRGIVWCCADNEDGLLNQLAAAFTTGNTPLIGLSTLEKNVFASLPEKLRTAIVTTPEPVKHPHLSGILFSGPQEAYRELKQQQAMREGAILPIVRCHANGFYPLYRLLKERTLTANTASAGGDTNLMMLGD